MFAILSKICPKQCRNVAIFFSLSFLFLKLVGFFDFNECKKSAERIDQYGLPFSIFLYTLKMLALLSLPNNIQMLIFSLFYRKEKLPRTSISFFPKVRICFRIVTRGDYPQMVKESVENILDLMKKFEFSNFLIEVLANKSIYLASNEKVRELVVPVDYTTLNGSKYKARYDIDLLIESFLRYFKIF